MKALTDLGFIEGEVFFTYELENGGFMLITKATGNIYFREASLDCLMQLSVFSSVEQVTNLLKALQ